MNQTMRAQKSTEPNSTGTIASTDQRPVATERGETNIQFSGDLNIIGSLSPRTVDSLQGLRKKLRRHVRLGKPRSNFKLANWSANITAPQMIGFADDMIDERAQNWLDSQPNKLNNVTNRDGVR